MSGFWYMVWLMWVPLLLCTIVAPSLYIAGHSPAATFVGYGGTFAICLFAIAFAAIRDPMGRFPRSTSLSRLGRMFMFDRGDDE